MNRSESRGDAENVRRTGRLVTPSVVAMPRSFNDDDDAADADADIDVDVDNNEKSDNYEGRGKIDDGGNGFSRSETSRRYSRAARVRRDASFHSQASPSQQQQQQQQSQQQQSLQEQQVPPISMQSIVQSLTLNDVRLSVVDIVKYAVFTSMVLVMLLYLFPQQILMIMMLVLFLLFLIVYIALQRINIKNRRVDLEKLERLRRARSATIVRYD